MALAVSRNKYTRHGNVACGIILNLALQTRGHIVGAPRIHQLGTERAGHHNAVALLPRRAIGAHDGAVVKHARHGRRHEATHHVGVAGETARVQDDAQTRLDALLLAAICDDNALHLAVSVGQQTRDLGIEHEFRTLLLGLLAQRLGEAGADAVGVLMHTRHSRRHVSVVVDHGSLGRQAIGGKGRTLLGQPVDSLAGFLGIQAAQLGVLEALGHGRQILVELLDRIIDAGLFLQLRASTLNHSGTQG